MSSTACRSIRGMARSRGAQGAPRRVRAGKEMAERVKSRLDELTGDQARIRENIAKIEKESTLYKPNIEKLSQRETEFEGLQAASAKAAAETQAARAAIDAYIAKLSI